MASIRLTEKPAPCPSLTKAEDGLEGVGIEASAHTMALTFKETRAISGLVEVVYDFLPGSGHSAWKGHVNFGTVASRVGLGSYWQGGSKKPAINALFSQRLEHKRSSFEGLILENRSPPSRTGKNKGTRSRPMKLMRSMGISMKSGLSFLSCGTRLSAIR